MVEGKLGLGRKRCITVVGAEPGRTSDTTLTSLPRLLLAEKGKPRPAGLPDAGRRLSGGERGVGVCIRACSAVTNRFHVGQLPAAFLVCSSWGE